MTCDAVKYTDSTFTGDFIALILCLWLGSSQLSSSNLLTGDDMKGYLYNEDIGRSTGLEEVFFRL